MKQTMKKLLAAVLTAAMILSLALTAGAAELKGSADFDDVIKGVSPDYPMAESLQPASGSAGAPGIFALMLETDQGSTCLTAFLLEKDGNVYLVADGNFAEVIAASKLTLKSSGNGGYSQKASVVGSDFYFVYLSASGMENFTCLTAARETSGKGAVYVEVLKNGEASGLSSVKVDFSALDIYTLNNSEDVAAFDTDEQPLDILLGAPVVEEGTDQVFAFGSAAKHPENGNVCPVFFTILDADMEEDYALAVSGGNSGGGQKEDDGDRNDHDPDDDEKRRDDEKDDEDDEEREEDHEEESEEKNVLWIIVAVVVAGAAFAFYRSRTQGGTPGKVEMDRDEPAPVADPGFGPITRCQLRGVSGCFSGQTFPVNGILRMGRSDQCQIRFPNGTPGISANHCQISLENGSIVLRDLGSTYGTFVKDSKLTPNVPCSLNPGDTVTLAEGETFQVECPAAAETGGITVRDIQGREYHTDSERMTFGRGQDNKVVFSPEDKGVSSKHCILYKENGKLYLMDVGSTNGTFFSEENRLEPNTPYRIRKGMAFFLTNRKNTFVVVEE